jgi:hypothetical protein
VRNLGKCHRKLLAAAGSTDKRLSRYRILIGSLRFTALDLRQSFDLTEGFSSTDILLEDRASPRFRKVRRMRRLYFCALVLGFVGFFGNRINARSSDGVVTGPPNSLSKSHNACVPRLSVRVARHPRTVRVLKIVTD